MVWEMEDDLKMFIMFMIVQENKEMHVYYASAIYNHSPNGPRFSSDFYFSQCRGQYKPSTQPIFIRTFFEPGK